ncbi:MAG: hypothetical protein IPM38_09355 [Ignavibacteria bacterium]|nr:hypothetical protein [Ignavibacteria bacterium]
MKLDKTIYFYPSGQLVKNAFCENLFFDTLQTIVNKGFAEIDAKSFL